jgi:ABC-type dipeptide/oligopeptide/nickel transport system permease subunit
MKHRCHCSEILLCVFFTGLLLFVSAALSVWNSYNPSSLQGGLLSPSPQHIFGTDFLGRDILSRTLCAAWISIVIGVLTRFISVAIGLAAGFLAASLPGYGARCINTFIEVFMAIPALLLAMALSVVMGESYLTIFVAIAAGTWAPVARFTSVQVLEISRRDYVTACRALGASRMRIACSHILPAFLPTLIPTITSGIATAIMIESTLSFLGLGGGMTASQVPTWGKLINEGSKFIFDAPWLIIPPAVLLTLVVIVFNRIGDIIADRSIR